MIDNKEAYWIWYPGDWEVWLHQEISVKRDVRQVIFPPFWRIDHHYSSVIFTYEYELEEAEEVFFKADGRFSVYLDDKDNDRYDSEIIPLPAGKHTLKVAVYNNLHTPALYAKGKTIFTNADWEVSCYDQNWKKPGGWKEVFFSPEMLPSQYELETELQHPIQTERRADGWFVDFGKETFGFLKLNGISGKSDVTVYYGESKEEAEDWEHCVLFDQETIDSSKENHYTIPHSRAFRYVYIVPEATDFSIESVSMDYEYLPVEYRSHFRSSDELLNTIWDTSLYTFHLNTREFFLDGIKRDRWVWSGDAYQSFLINYYSFFDQDVAKRTLIALRGKDPVVSHINTILDYSLYWLISMHDYYLHTGDLEFVNDQYENMVSLMDFCLTRRNDEGMIEGQGEDWVFIDWADIDNRGEVSTIQLLFCKSLEAISDISRLVGKGDQAQYYQEQADKLKKTIMDVFWDEDKGGFVHHRLNGELGEKVTKYPNMFALLYGYLDKDQAEKVKTNVLLNDDIQKIKTPYMRFFELASLCEIEEHDVVLEEIRDYWGGMLALGATTFWEEYNPQQEGNEHYEMYGAKYGKSLCHAWGASPIYILSKYFLGVQPLSPGYETFIVEPRLGGLEWIEGKVPIGAGEVEVYMDKSKIRVKASKGKGKLKFVKHGTTTEEHIPSDGTYLEIDL